jgi:hypothetical protein
MWKPLRILIIEDSDDDREWLRREPRGRGYEVESAQANQFESLLAPVFSGILPASRFTSSHIF